MLAWITETLGPWTWWALGLVLLGLEILLPGVFLMWFGLAALVVGAFALTVPTSWAFQIFLFAVLSVLAVIAGRMLVKFSPSEEDGNELGPRGSRYVGKVYFLKEPIADGEGRLNIDDTIWRVKGPDIEAGRKVRVVAVDSARLIVEPGD